MIGCCPRPVLHIRAQKPVREILREDGKLSLDDSPLDYVPGLKFYNGDMNNNIIIKDLMRHSTGLPRHDGAWYFFPNHNQVDQLTSYPTNL